MGDNIKWVGSAVARAPRIPQTEWDRHRDELCQLYTKMKLADVMVVMKDRYGFAPTKRQYVTQFDRWDVHKYERREPNQLSPVDGPSSSPSASAESDPDPKSEIPVNQPMPETENSSNSFHIRSPDVTPNSSLSPDPAPDLEPNPPYHSRYGHYLPQPQPRPQPQPQPQPQHQQILPDRSRVSLGSQMSLDKPDGGVRIPSPSRVPSSQRSAISIDMRESYESINQVPESSTSAGSSPASSTTRDAACEAGQLKLIADFLFAARLYQNAFKLYVKILKWLDTNPGYPKLTTSSIVGCARSASSQVQIRIAKNLLESKMANGFYAVQGTPETCLFRSLLADIYVKLGDKAKAKEHRRLAQMQFDNKNCTLSQKASSASKPFNLVTGKNAMKDVKRGRILNARDVAQRYLQQQNGSSGSRSKRTSDGCLRTCLKWCLHELKKNCNIRTSQNDIRSDGELDFELQTTALFCELWRRWLERLNAPGRNREPISWADTAEEEMKASPAEFLSIMCRTILTAYPVELGFFAVDTIVIEIEKQNMTWEQRIARRASYAVRQLNHMSDHDLACAFLESYTEHYKPIKQSSAAKAPINISHNYVKAYVQDSLNIRWAAIDGPIDNYGGEEDICNVIASLDLNDTPDNSQSDLGPTFTRSLSSTDFRTFTRMGDRGKAAANASAGSGWLRSGMSPNGSAMEGILGNYSMASVLDSAQ